MLRVVGEKHSSQSGEEWAKFKGRDNVADSVTFDHDSATSSRRSTLYQPRCQPRGNFRGARSVNAKLLKIKMMRHFQRNSPESNVDMAGDTLTCRVALDAGNWLTLNGCATANRSRPLP